MNDLKGKSMINHQTTPLENAYVNFLFKCVDFNNLEFFDFKDMSHRTELFVVQSVSSERGFNSYALKKYLFLEWNEKEKYIELEDGKGNYAGQIPFGDNGCPTFSLNKITGSPDAFEKTFLNYISAQRYMHNLKYICDVLEDAYLLKLLQQINKIDKGNNER